MNHPRSIFQPLPGRSCGECQACCIEPEIDDPDLRKPEGAPCQNLGATGCTIYARRPATCATWYCGWRLINMSDALRPDRSKVLMTPEMCTEPGYEKGGLSLAPLAGAPIEVLLDPKIVDLAGQFVSRGVPLFLAYGSGQASRRVLINELGKDAVRTGDRARFVQVLRGLLAELEAQVGSSTAS